MMGVYTRGQLRLHDDVHTNLKNLAKMVNIDPNDAEEFDRITYVAHVQKIHDNEHVLVMMIYLDGIPVLKQPWIIPQLYWRPANTLMDS